MFSLVAETATFALSWSIMVVLMVDSGTVVLLGSSWLDNPSCSLLRLPNQFYEPFLITIVMDVYNIIQIWSNLSQIILYTLGKLLLLLFLHARLHAYGLTTVVALASKLRSVTVSLSLDNPSCNYSIIACLVTNRGIYFSKVISLPLLPQLKALPLQIVCNPLKDQSITNTAAVIRFVSG